MSNRRKIQTTPADIARLDQLATAARETAKAPERIIPAAPGARRRYLPPGDYQWLRDRFEEALRDNTLCVHLAACRDQPAFWTPLRRWACESCRPNIAIKAAMCSICPNPLSDDNRFPLVTQSGQWVVELQLCGRCIDKVDRLATAVAAWHEIKSEQ